jgi:hypothetical protein
MGDWGSSMTWGFMIYTANKILLRGQTRENKGSRACNKHLKITAYNILWGKIKAVVHVRDKDVRNNIKMNIIEIAVQYTYAFYTHFVAFLGR